MNYFWLSILRIRHSNQVVRSRRRQRIPDKPNISFSLWNIMKNCIGKDLSKIPVPVNFSEPLSMLQRLVEDFEYSEILDSAAQCSDNCEQVSLNWFLFLILLFMFLKIHQFQMAFVAAFTVSSYSTTAIRTGKPFNPLLGETYECDRTGDKNWKCISEQVLAFLSALWGSGTNCWIFRFLITHQWLHNTVKA